MNFIKKWGASLVSLVVGVLGLALSTCSGLIVKVLLGGKIVMEETTKAHKIITDTDLADAAELMQLEGKFTLLKIASIIMMVISVLVLIYAIVMILKNINVVKGKDKTFGKVNLLLNVLLLVSVIAVLVATFVYGNGLADKLNVLQFGGIAKVTVSVGVYQWAMLAVSVVGLLVAFLSNNKKSKK